MSAPLRIGITGIGVWLPGAPDWDYLHQVLRGERALAADAPTRPAATVLPAAERRRAPDGVRLAAEVAAQACAMAGIDPAGVPCVFASSHGETAISDYVCATLARAPLELSPTQFHNSVLNAPAGYWTIATACTAASSAVTALDRSFAAGLLEAVVLACAEDTPVLYGCCDVASTGPLAAMTRTRLAFGVALLLTPATHKLQLRLTPADHALAPVAAPVLALADVAGDNPANGHALALLAALANGEPARLTWPLSSGLALELEIAP